MPKDTKTAWYSWYVLIVLTLVYLCSMIDRHVITILAPYIKSDLGITDAQIGLLYGTAFALFYGLFGIPLAKLADCWSRTKTIALSLCFWTAMTTVSGFSSNFVQLSLARIGVGIGEAAASPAAVSLIGDYFPKSKRGTALAIYAMSITVGAGVALVVGGAIVAAWQLHYPPGVRAPFGLSAWQAAFIAVGLPGFVLALLVRVSIREPIRGVLEGLPMPLSTRPLAAVLSELETMIPPWSLVALCRGRHFRAAWVNVVALMSLIVFAILITRATDNLLAVARRPIIFRLGDYAVTSNVVQWSAMAAASYAFLSWIQAIRSRDNVSHRLVAGNRNFMILALTCSFMSISLYSINSFNFIYGVRYVGLGPRDGAMLGSIAMIFGAAGMLLAGVLGDHWRRKNPAGRTYLCIGSFAAATVSILIQYSTTSPKVFFICWVFTSTFIIMWSPLVNATIQDLVLPRMRGLGLAVSAFGSSLGLGLGPYTVGLISDVTSNLRFAVLSTIAFTAPISILALIYLARVLPSDEASLVSRARAAGEPV